MITKITNTNEGLYKSLFSFANKILGKTEENKIETLEQFFAYYSNIFPAITDLQKYDGKDLEDADKEALKNYFRFLPLDESLFEIDINTRNITVPEDYKKSGISVQGDKDSEVLYFLVDRFVENVDLFKTTPIIQWERTTGDTQQHIDSSVYKDIYIFSDSNKMLFGWPITDIITETSGTIKFSVRFYKKDSNNDTLLYSLSTLPATVFVNAGLDYYNKTGKTFNANIEDEKESIEARLNWGSVTLHLDYNGTLTPPSITKNISDYLEDNNMDVDLHTFTDTANKKYIVLDLNEDNGSYKYDIKIRSLISGKTNTPQYALLKYNNGDWDFSNIQYQKEYEPVPAGTSKDTSEVYWKKVGDVFSIEENYNDIPDTIVADTYYYEVIKFTITEPGDYQIRIANIAGKVPAYTYSDIIRIPGPGVLTLDYAENNSNKMFLGDNSKITLSAVGSSTQTYKTQLENIEDGLFYEWFKNNDDTTSIGTNSSYIVDAIDEAQYSAVGSEEKLNENLTYYTRNNTEPYIYTTQSVNADNFKDFGQLYVKDCRRYDETFKVKSVAKRNGVSSQEKSLEFRVTDEPYAFTEKVLLNIHQEGNTASGTKKSPIWPVFKKEQLENQVCDEIEWVLFKIVDQPDYLNSTEDRADLDVEDDTIRSNDEYGDALRPDEKTKYDGTIKYSDLFDNNGDLVISKDTYPTSDNGLNLKIRIKDIGRYYYKFNNKVNGELSDAFYSETFMID